MASPAVNELKTVEKQQDNYKFTKDCGAQKRHPMLSVKPIILLYYSNLSIKNGTQIKLKRYTNVYCRLSETLNQSW